jgi:hypothetical protein
MYNIDSKMFYKDQYDPAEYDYDVFSTNSNNQKAALEEAKKIDRGYNKIWRMLPRSDETLKRTKIEFYTSSGTGFFIRDAETGKYFNDKVGSADEDLYFKVGFATGECKSANGSSTLFYTSPYKYMTHMHCTLPLHLIKKWQEKRDARMSRNNKEVKNPVASTILVH